MVIITNQDYLNTLYGYKRIHCPKLTGLSKQQLGQLARRMGLDVIPSGKKRRPDGLGTGKHKYKKRLPTTWRGTPQERELERNRAFNEYFDRRERGDMKAERLDKAKKRDEELERVRAEQEKGQMGAEDKDAPAKEKPKPKPKKKLKIVKPEPEPEPKVDIEQKDKIEMAKNKVKRITDNATKQWETSDFKNVIKRKQYIFQVFDGLYRKKRPERYNRNDEQNDYDLRNPDDRVRMIMDISN